MKEKLSEKDSFKKCNSCDDCDCTALLNAYKSQLYNEMAEYASICTIVEKENSTSTSNTDKGVHVIIDIHDYEDKKLLDDFENIKHNVEKYVIEHFGFTCVGNLVYKFNPIGVTMIFLLTESHISIHTWPEDNYVSMDIYTCKNVEDTYVYVENLVKQVVTKVFPGSISFIYHILERGKFEPILSHVVPLTKSNV